MMYKNIIAGAHTHTNTLTQYAIYSYTCNSIQRKSIELGVCVRKRASKRAREEASKQMIVNSVGNTRKTCHFIMIFARLVVSIFFFVCRKLFVFNGYYYYGFSFHRFALKALEIVSYQFVVSLYRFYFHFHFSVCARPFRSENVN